MPGNNAVLSVFPKEEKLMPRTVAIGIQDFQKIRIQDTFYIDKTNFIEEWWESRDDVTLITRPRRFGKTLTMSMVEQFFSVNCPGCGNIFEGLSIWEKEKYRQLQGSYPVISLSFSNIKETTFCETRKKNMPYDSVVIPEIQLSAGRQHLNRRRKRGFSKNYR